MHYMLFFLFARFLLRYLFMCAAEVSPASVPVHDTICGPCSSLWVLLGAGLAIPAVDKIRRSTMAVRRCKEASPGAIVRTPIPGSMMTLALGCAKRAPRIRSLRSAGLRQAQMSSRLHSRESSVYLGAWRKGAVILAWNIATLAHWTPLAKLCSVHCR